MVKEVTRLRLFITGQSKMGGEIHWFNWVEPPDGKFPVGERELSPEACIPTALVPALANLSCSCQVPWVVHVAQYLKDHLGFSIKMTMPSC